MQCLIELRNPRYELTWPEMLAYLSVRFLELAQTKCPVTHHFEPGMYIREMTIPKGILFIGKPHRHGHRVELISGSVMLVTDSGEFHLDAPYDMHTSPCYQTVFYTKTEVVGRTYHPIVGHRRDVEALENEIFRPADEVIMIGKSVRERIEKLDATALEGEAA